MEKMALEDSFEEGMDRLAGAARTAGALAAVGFGFARETIAASLRDVAEDLKSVLKNGDAQIGCAVEKPEGKRVVVWLIHPTNYRKDGTPRKWKRTILPANAIGQLAALMPKKIENAPGEQIPVEIHVLEDTVQPLDMRAISESMNGHD